MKDAEREYRFRFLVYPNITYRESLEKDSFVIVLANTVKALNAMRNDIHFTVLIPQEIDSLKAFDNVEQVTYELPSNPNTMRTHFDATRFLRILDWKNKDFDVVYSHLPEHTLQISNLLVNSTNISPAIVGYCHWYEIDENTSHRKRMFLANIAGTLEMLECGVNSEWLKSLLLEKASKHFSTETMKRLSDIIQPHLLGVDSVYRGKHDTIEQSLLFNHRGNQYTGFKWLIDVLDSIYQQRKDFTLYTTLADIDRPYAKRIDIKDRCEYLKFVRRMNLGISAFDKYSAWSIATTDGLSQGVPYLLPNKFCYPEMVGEDYPLFYNNRDDFQARLLDALDNPKRIASLRLKVQEFSQSMLWRNRVSEWFGGWKFLDTLPSVGKSDAYADIVKYIKRRGAVSKKEILKYMHWGQGIGWSKYRNRLRKEPGIRFTVDRYLGLKDF